jgi:hypothetical protein
MHGESRKKDKAGALALSQSKARALATGIGQSRDAAMMTGSSRAYRVAAEIPAKQKAALCATSGYPMLEESMTLVSTRNPAKTAAIQTNVSGRIP